jgi:hypothetical protein
MNISRKTLAAAAMAAVLPLLLGPALMAQDEDPPSAVARIGYMQGAVSLQPSGEGDWSDAPPNYPLISGDRLYTDQGARAIIQNGSSDVRLWGQTDVTLTNLTDQYEQIGLAQGSVRVRVFALNPDNTIEVDTPNGAVIIQQPGDYRINAYSGDASLVAVNSGSVQVTGPGVNQEVDQGQAVQIYGTNPIELGLVEMPGYDDLDRWSIDRDHHILNSVSARYVSRDIPGYDDLDDYGGWTPTPDYGPVWYPRTVAVGWQPYTVGHWAYVRPWGYTWVDDAPWGYAPFHYGRWAVIGGRWGWVPGPPNVRPVYSPALVAFVGNPGGVSVGFSFGGGVSVAAWFPLGVAEPYVPWYHCSPRYVTNVNVTNVNITVIKNVTVINNYNTFISNTRTVTNVNQINVTNVNYVNRQRVYAVPANSFSLGARVQQAAVHLNQQQVQQLSRAPVAVARPIAPAPQRPLLQARPSVSRPVTRPSLMTPHGVAQATPAANRPSLRPVSLPKPQPATAIKPATRPIAPNLKPAAPVAARPGAPNVKPVAPVSNTKPATPAPNAKPATPASNVKSVAPAPARPGTPANARPVTAPTAPATRPTAPANNTRPAAPANAAKPAAPAGNARPAPQPVAKPAQPARPETKPAQPEARPAPQPAARPEKPTAAKPETRPAPQTQARPQTTRPAEPARAETQQHPAQPAAKPAAKPQGKPAPKKEPEKKPEEKPE